MKKSSKAMSQFKHLIINRLEADVENEMYFCGSVTHPDELKETNTSSVP